MKKFIYQKLYKILNLLCKWFPYPVFINRKIMIGTSLLMIAGGQAVAQNKETSNHKEVVGIVEPEIPDLSTIELIMCYYPADLEEVERVVDQSIVYEVVEEMPVFPEGDIREYIQNHITYPDEIIAQGRVIIRFVINEDGSISDEEILRSIDADLDRNALEVIRNMPKWNPGKQYGVPVKVRFVVPVNYRR